MRALFFTSSFILALAALGCSSNDKSDSTPTDSGTKTDAKTDGSVRDGGVEDDDGPPSDTGGMPSDTASSTDTGTKVDTGTASGCDKHVGDACDLVLQNCPSADDSCVYSSSTKANVCAKVTTGPGLKGEPCTKNEDCDKGLSCYDDGKCSPACCTGNNSVCGAGGTCSLAITDSTDKVIYHACSYNAVCNPFKYDCPTGQLCLFSEAPSTFKCSTPSSAGAVSKAPGGACTYVNDCGESQTCTQLTSGGDAGSGRKCYLFCWLSKPIGFMPGTMPDGRFAANGDCMVNGTNYGTCSMITGIGGGLGMCIP